MAEFIKVSIDDQMKDIRHRFTNHPPTNESVHTLLDELTSHFISLGDELVQILPDGREKALALTNLEQCSMWAKASIARNQ